MRRGLEVGVGGLDLRSLVVWVGVLGSAIEILGSVVARVRESQKSWSGFIGVWFYKGLGSGMLGQQF